MNNEWAVYDKFPTEENYFEAIAGQVEPVVIVKTAGRTLLDYAKSWAQRYNKDGKEKEELKISFVIIAKHLFALTDKELLRLKHNSRFSE